MGDVFESKRVRDYVTRSDCLGYQVWSLTQFYSVDFSQSRNGVKKCVFNKRTIQVCVNCFCQVSWDFYA